MKLSKTYLIIPMIALLLLSACDQKKSKSSPARMARNPLAQPFIQGQQPVPGTNNPQQPVYPNTNGSSTGSEWVYLQSNDTYGFSNAVKGLVSATMDPQELGYVNNYGDVALIGFIDMNQQGVVNQSNSRLRLEIWDDYARSGSASEIAIQFNNLTSYNYNGNQITLVFQDQYGQITISGQLTQYDFYGTVSFQNNQAFGGGSSFASGVLGNFQVPYCGFFRCQ